MSIKILGTENFYFHTPEAHVLKALVYYISCLLNAVVKASLISLIDPSAPQIDRQYGGFKSREFELCRARIEGV